MTDLEREAQKMCGCTPMVLGSTGEPIPCEFCTKLVAFAERKVAEERERLAALLEENAEGMRAKQTAAVFRVAAGFLRGRGAMTDEGGGRENR